MTEVWFRNPDNYIRECVEIGAPLLAWDRGYLVKKSLDPLKFADLYYPASTEYRMLLVGDQGTAELRRGDTQKNPTALYPTWEYGQDLDILEDYLADPVAGQEHRVVVIRTPSLSTGVGRQFMRQLAEMQQESNAILHLHGLYSWRAMFSKGIRSVDVDPRITAQKGKVILPNGKEVTYERAAQTPQWVRVLGTSVADLTVPRNRCMFNMRSAWWAAEYFNKDPNFTVRPTTPDNPDSVDFSRPETVRYTARAKTATLGDKFLCDICSLKDTCKYFRVGSVCTLPETEANEMAQMFGSRDADDIVEGLAILLKKQVERLQRGIDEEEDTDDGLDPEVSKAFNAVFANGVKLAKLRDPRLGGGPLVGINLTVPQDVLQGARPAELTSAAVKALEGQGIKRENITPEMLEKVLGPALKQSEQGEILEAEVVSDSDAGAAVIPGDD